MTQFFSSTRAAAELFEPFFDSGMEESISPFLSPSSRLWGKNIKLKSSLIAAFFLLCSFTLSFFPEHDSLVNLFLLLTYFFAGVPALISAIQDLASFVINIDVLMVLAAFLSVFIGSGKEGGLLLVLFSFSSAMERAVSSKAKGAIHSLKNLSPRSAHVVQDDGTLISRSVKDINPGTLIHVKAGELIPLDGEIVFGSSSISLVHLTGENLPISCKVADLVQSGSSNLEGALTIRVTHSSGDSTVTRIIRLITQAQETKPKLQRWFDKVTNRYAMTIIMLSFLIAISFPFFTSLGYLGPKGSIYRALAFLIAASPCALILAIPIAYLSAISSCAKQGILLKGGIILDVLSRCTTFAMDKTGTLTEGSLTCIDAPSGEALCIAYALEQNIDHPIATALCSYALEKGSKPAKISEFRSIPGFGIEATYQGKRVYMGNAKWIHSKVSNTKAIKHQEHQEDQLIALLLIGDQISYFRFKDRLRKETIETLSTLKNKWKMKLVMLTGDHKASAQIIAAEAHLTEYYADLTPEDKLKHIIQLAEKEDLVMIGDGINDAPALARATVGIAMGRQGTHTAASAADIVLLQDNIEKLGWLMAKAHSTVSIVRQNVILAGGAILFATLPALLGLIPLWLAVLIHEGGTVIVGLNALRLLRK